MLFGSISGDLPYVEFREPTVLFYDLRNSCIELLLSLAGLLEWLFPIIKDGLFAIFFDSEISSIV